MDNTDKKHRNRVDGFEDYNDNMLTVETDIKSDNGFGRQSVEEAEARENAGAYDKYDKCDYFDAYDKYDINPFNPNGKEGRLHVGHRTRLNLKADSVGFEVLPPHEQLEMILYAIIPRGNTNIIAHRLLDEFGSLYIISHTDVESLCSVDGVGRRTAEFLRMLPDMAGAFCRSELDNKQRTVLNTEKEAIKYIKSFFTGKTVEYLYMFSLNQSRRIIGVTRLSKGAKDTVNTSVKKIVSTALEDGANEVILAHNHPGGDPTPSQNDLEATHAIENVLHSLGIKLWLHLIVADNNCRCINFFNGDIYGQD